MHGCLHGATNQRRWRNTAWRTIPCIIWHNHQSRKRCAVNRMSTRYEAKHAHISDGFLLRTRIGVCYTQVRLTSKHSDLIPWKTAACPPSLTPNMSESALEKSDAPSLFSSPDAAKLFSELMLILAQFRRCSAVMEQDCFNFCFTANTWPRGMVGVIGGGRGCGWKWQNIGTNDENKMEGNIVFQNNSLIFRI